MFDAEGRTNPGRPVRVQLPAHALSGAIWTVSTAPPGVSVEREPEREDGPWPEGDAAAGRTGGSSYLITARKPGPAVVEFELRRPWEPTPFEVFRVRIECVPEADDQPSPGG